MPGMWAVVYRYLGAIGVASWWLNGPKSTTSQISIKCSPKYVPDICFSGINAICPFVHLSPHSGPTKFGNEKQ